MTKKKEKELKLEKETDDKKEIEEKPRRPLKSFLIVLLLLIALLYIYAHYMGPYGVKIKEYNIINENIPKSFDGFSIVQFSDLELNSTFKIEDLENLVEKINDLHPDIVVFTGDIKKGYKEPLKEEDKNKVIECFKKIDALIAKFAVRGDDDTGDTLYSDIMSASSFKDLTNDYELIYYKGLTPIVIYGLDSLLTGNQDYDKTFSYPSAEENTSYMATYRILLAHEPDTALNIGEYNISLMLSGHSHNSELNIPYLKDYFNIKGASKYHDSYYKVGNMDLYISSGLGTSKYNVRLLNKPSISIYRLYTD